MYPRQNYYRLDSAWVEMKHSPTWWNIHRYLVLLSRDNYTVETRSITFELLDAAADLRLFLLDMWCPNARIYRDGRRVVPRIKASTRKTLGEMGIAGGSR